MMIMAIGISATVILIQTKTIQDKQGQEEIKDSSKETISLTTQVKGINQTKYESGQSRSIQGEIKWIKKKILSVLMTTLLGAS